MNKMKKYLKILIVGVVIFSSSCMKDLDTIPLDDESITSEKIYQDPANYKLALAKCYIGLAVGGNDGGDGDGDIVGIDGGFSQYLRLYWYSQELSTDEAIIGWNDATIKDFHYQTWSTSDVFITAMYYRVMFQITLCNSFIKNSTPAKLEDRGIGSEYYEDIALYHAEARFLRALSYWHGLDLFRGIPYVTEDDPIGAWFPEQAKTPELFSKIESELIALTDGVGGDDLADPNANEYGRADKAAAWMLLAKLYLNAEVYLGEGNSKYTEAITTLNKVISAGYSLESDFTNNFKADNDNSDEIIFPIAFDGTNTQTWGGTTILVHAAIGGTMTAADYGVGGGWGGIRTTAQVVDKADIGNDTRAIFYTDGQNKEINDVSLFTDGYATPKFSNMTSTGEAGKNADFVDTDFPVFRLADAYLMYAEAVLRGGTGGDASTALGYVNQLRERAYGNTSGNISSSELDLDFILDERCRELYWEGHRRTDLVRFNKFTGDSYLWAWKGNLQAGRSTDSYRDVYPIPVDDLNANKNLTQNDGY
ncbi:MAG TPA: RagB/SusD family nutrient uptake outer membrane protein [Marinilabiliales bacterium]|jgi:hypothetical protein|nr:MAG: hypothetical protein A2W84_15560 [Bacteroidetes bacterium GWC2_40_13]OFX72356.1 MAG: hypothetical protein A2W96_18175 [Bacteroidetes bacterium GWD2_40_43]OFX90398.1 MAG: hypothetical protein A2W97_01225 [Bacteroidetes bacterium GWE2_40_63]OFY17357.1 MAG: hypothetical protein A2W88_15640 [Bacteroidetes bacterium GWF2_40_13]HAN00931.1 RagB/SusD family nutrient uptake outer membrane protein [Marinilabiliales bacterium]